MTYCEVKEYHRREYFSEHIEGDAVREAVLSPGHRPSLPVATLRARSIVDRGPHLDITVVAAPCYAITPYRWRSSPQRELCAGEGPVPPPSYSLPTGLAKPAGPMQAGEVCPSCRTSRLTLQRSNRA
jgi:hypothetical protein